MTLDQVQVIRDKYYQALLDLDVNQLNHSINGASYDWDSHRESLEKQFEYWDNLYNVKAAAGTTRRLNKKAV